MSNTITKTIKKYLTQKDIEASLQKRGMALKEENGIVLVKTKSPEIFEGSSIYTVWKPEENFIFIHSQDIDEALEVFEKYTKKETRI